MGKWVLEKEPEMVPFPIDPKQFQQNIAEIAEILYHYFCQLDPKPILAKAIRPEIQSPTRVQEDRR